MTVQTAFRPRFQPIRTRVRTRQRGPWPTSPFVGALSANRRYLLDQYGRPYFLNGTSPQAMAVQATTTDMAAYIADQAGRGVNSMQVHLVCSSDGGPAGFGGGNAGGVNINGDAPFATMSTFTTPNAAYWAVIDTLIDTCASYGITVWASPAEHESQGTTLAGLTNAQADSFGSFIGNRYKTRPNIVWSWGNDWQDYTNGNNESLHVRRIIDAMKAAGDTHMHTIWPMYFNGTSWDLSDFDSYHDVVFVYTYYVTYYDMELAYTDNSPGSPQPCFLGEANYDNDGLQNFGPATAWAVETTRRQMWWTMTCGGCGHFFTSYDIEHWAKQATANGHPNYDWTHRNNTVPSQHRNLFATLMKGFARWYDLVPDFTNSFMTGGRGTKSTNHTLDVLDSDWATGAVTPDGTLAVCYYPTFRGSISLNMGLMGGAPTAYWYDPTNGATSTEASPATPTHPNANAAGDHDWVLVVQAAARNTQHHRPRPRGTVIPHMARRRP